MLRIVGSLLLVSAVAFAQASPDSTRLFDEGRGLAKDGKWADACDRFTKSLALDHAIGTVLNLGDCHEHLGHLVEAWQYFDEAATLSAKTDNDTRTRLARSRADALAARLGTVVIKLADPTGASLTIGGRAVTPAARVEQRVAPGDVEIVWTPAGKPPVARTAHVEAGASAELELGGPAEAPSHPGAPVADVTSHGERRHTRVVAAYTLGGFGAAALVTGVVIGFVAKGNYDDAIKSCQTGGGAPICPLQAYNDAKDATSLANVGTGVGIAGLVMVGVAAGLYVTAPRDVVISPSATAQSGGVTISGRF